MKKTKKILSLVLALVMILGLAAPAVMAQEVTKTEKVTLHKLLMSAQDLKDWDSDKNIEKNYDGTQDLAALGLLAGRELKEIDKVYFAWQAKDAEGNWKYIKNDGTIISTDPALTKEAFEAAGVFGMETGVNGAEFNTSELPQDKATQYKIVEVKELSTYKNDQALLTDSKAVPVDITLPLVNKDGVQAEVHVYPKNTEEKPEIDKNFASKNDLTAVDKDGKEDVLAPNVGAQYKNYDAEKARVTAEIGKKIPYEVKTKIPAKSSYQKVKWTDSMSKGLTYNKDFAITADNGIAFEAGDYKVIADDHGFTAYLTESGLKKVQNKDNDINITITYSATVNADAVVDEPQKNDIKFDYGNKPSQENEPTTTTPKNGEITVEKDWAVDGNAVTETDKNVEAVFTLQVQEDGTWKDVESYKVTAAENFTHTFTGLDNEKIYRVVERVSGYEPVYTETDETGKILISNKKDSSNPKPLDPTEPEVVVGGKKFVKADKSTGKRLEGATFVVKKGDKFLSAKDSADLQKAMEEYKKADEAYKAAVESLTQNEDGSINYPEGLNAEEIAKLRATRDAKFAEANKAYEWVDSQDNASKFTSNANGQVEVNGLAYGDYILEEIDAPDGYAVPTNNKTPFKVEKDSYKKEAGGVVYEGTENVVTGAEGADAIRIDNQLITIPQTGGIGTIIFVVVGLALMAGAVIVMRKRNQAE